MSDPVDKRARWKCGNLGEISKGRALRPAISTAQDQFRRPPPEPGADRRRTDDVRFRQPNPHDWAVPQVCFGAARDRWSQRTINGRECRWPDKELLDQWVCDYGEDSDFVRVRVRGLPPRASDAQFISHDLVFGAQTRPAVAPLPDEPLVVGLDVARGGADECVFRFRRGLDAASLETVRMLGEEARDSMRLASAERAALEDSARS